MKLSHEEKRKQGNEEKPGLGGGGRVVEGDDVSPSLGTTENQFLEHHSSPRVIHHPSTQDWPWHIAPGAPDTCPSWGLLELGVAGRHPSAPACRAPVKESLSKVMSNKQHFLPAAVVRKTHLFLQRLFCCSAAACPPPVTQPWA